MSRLCATQATGPLYNKYGTDVSFVADVIPTTQFSIQGHRVPASAQGDVARGSTEKRAENARRRMDSHFKGWQVSRSSAFHPNSLLYRGVYELRKYVPQPSLTLPPRNPPTYFCEPIYFSSAAEFQIIHFSILTHACLCQWL